MDHSLKTVVCDSMKKYLEKLLRVKTQKLNSLVLYPNSSSCGHIA